MAGRRSHDEVGHLPPHQDWREYVKTTRTTRQAGSPAYFPTNLNLSQPDGTPNEPEKLAEDAVIENSLRHRTNAAGNPRGRLANHRLIANHIQNEERKTNE